MNTKPVSKDLTTLATTIALSHYVTTPIFESFSLFLLESGEKLLSDKNNAIKQGELVHLSRNLIGGNNSLKTKNRKNIHKGLRGSLKLYSALSKVIDYIETTICK